MKRLSKPIFTGGEVYDACVNNISEQSLNDRFVAAKTDVMTKANEYEVKASTHDLYLLPASAWGKGWQISVADLTKAELISLYEDHLLEKKTLGRQYYDKLMMLAPLGKCPFCGFGHASTLDHFLSKSRYPTFSVLPFNLVPSCKDCNTGKKSAALTKSTQLPHPYFESALVETDVWLFAEVLHSNPATVIFFAKPPAGWQQDLTDRVKTHFKDFHLASRFSVEAASELVSICDTVSFLKTPDERKEHLHQVAQIERSSRKNSWKAALYEALDESDWFQQIGYQHTPQ